MWPLSNLFRDQKPKTRPTQRLRLEALEDRLTPTAGIVAAANGTVQEFTASGAVTSTLTPYAGYLGEVFIAQGDVNKDGTSDIITGTGVAASHVKVFDGNTRGELFSFLAFPGFAGGVSVGSTDINNDGFDDITVGAASGTSPHVKVFSGVDGTLLASFLTLEPTAKNGVRVGGGDLNGDNFGDIVVSARGDSPTIIRAYSGNGFAQLLGFDVNTGDIGTVSFRGHVNVAVLNGNLLASFDAGAVPRVKVFTPVGVGAALVSANFFAYDAGFLGGVRVAGEDIDGDGIEEIVTGSGLGASHIKVFNSASLAEVSSFLAFNNFPGGVRI